MSDQQPDGENRRESFRLDDTITFRMRVLDEESLASISQDFNAFRLRYCMKSHMQNQKNIRKPKLVRIKNANSDIADYLDSLEVQIGQLAERLDQRSDVSGDAVEFTSRANLSATGIHFRTDMVLKAGDVIEIGIVLSTQSTQVVMLAEVLRVEDIDDKQFAVSASYSHIHPEDTDAIIRHLARLQQQELQARRGSG